MADHMVWGMTAKIMHKMPSNEGKTHWNKQNAMWGTLLTCWKACSWLRSLGCENLLPCAAWLVQNWSHRRHLVASSKVLCQMGWALGWSRSGEHDQGTLGRTQQEATGSWSAIQNLVLYTGISFQNTNIIISTVHTDSVAPLGARISPGKVMTKFPDRNFFSG